MRALLVLLLTVPLFTAAEGQERRTTPTRGERVRAKIPLFQDVVLTEERYVDAEALRRRQRAMVEEGRSFRESLPRVRKNGTKERHRAIPVAAPIDSPAPDHSLKLILAVGFIVLCAMCRLVLIPLRRRSERRTVCE